MKPFTWCSRTVTILVGVIVAVVASSVWASIPAARGSISVDDPIPPQVALQFDGTQTNYVEVPNSGDFSVGDLGLTVAVWVRPDTFQFNIAEPNTPQCQYVHWLGKGDTRAGDVEWTFRMYRDDATACSGTPPDRSKRVSFYVFAPEGGRGCGSYFQDDIQPGRWIHVVGVVDTSSQTVAIYKNGNFRHRDSYASLGLMMGAENMRMATRDARNSFFQGALAQVQIWNQPLGDDLISALYQFGTVPDGLVAQYSLNEGSGSTVQDSAGGHAAGTIFGGTWDFNSYPLDISPVGRSGGGC